MIKIKQPVLKIPNEFDIKRIDRFLIKHAEKGKEPELMNWAGQEIFYMLFYLYLFEKYKQKCLVRLDTNLGFDSSIVIKIGSSKKETETILKGNKRNFKQYAKQISNCINRNQEIIIIPVVIVFTQDELHANVLVYNSRFKHFSLFEPYGTLDLTKDIETTLFTYLISEINKYIPLNKKVTYTPSYSICPPISMQRLEETTSRIVKNEKIESRGYCAIWSLFFSELVLANPERNTKQLYSDIYNYLIMEVGMGNAADYLRYIARGYVKVVNEKLNKHFKTLYDTNMDMTNYVKFVKELPTATYVIYKIIFNVYMNVMYELQLTTIDDLYNTYEDMKKLPGYRETLKDKEHPFTIKVNIIEKIRNREIFKNITPLTGDKSRSISKPQLMIETKNEGIEESKIDSIKEISDKINHFSAPKVPQEQPKKKERKEKKEKMISKPLKTKPPCKPGKERNEKGRCVKPKSEKVKEKTEKKQKQNKTIKVIKLEKEEPGESIKNKTIKVKPPCKPGKERNEKGRCVKIKTEKQEKVKKEKSEKVKKETKNKTIKVQPPCKPGKARNEKGRCVKIENIK